MTRDRVFGDDTPFGAWLRAQPSLDSTRSALAASDVDMMLHRYKANIDGMGSRRVALMMNVEVKTRLAMPSDSQRQTLFFQHQLLHEKRALRDIKPGKVSVWHFGYFVLSISGERPDESDEMYWMRFADDGSFEPDPVTHQQLLDILGFRLNPETLRDLSLRRHHKTRRIIMRELTPLGFEVDRVLTRHS